MSGTETYTSVLVYILTGLIYIYPYLKTVCNSPAFSAHGVYNFGIHRWHLEYIHKRGDNFQQPVQKLETCFGAEQVM